MVIEELFHEIRDEIKFPKGGYPGGSSQVVEYSRKVEKDPARAALITEELTDWQKYLADLSEEETQSLLHFIYFAKLDAQKIADAYHEALNGEPNGLTDPVNLKKRAEIVRFVANYGTNYTQDELEAEVEIEEQLPVFWLDALDGFGWEITFPRVIEKTKKGEINITDFLLDSMPSYAQEFPKEECRKLVADLSENIDTQEISSLYQIINRAS